MKIVMVDCDHDSFEPEFAVAAANSVDFSVVQSKDASELVANATGADGILMQYAAITGEVLDRMPGVRAIGRYGVGYDTIDVAAATARGVAICTVPDYGTESVSDHAIALALNSARAIAQLDRGLRAGSTDIVPVMPLHEIGGRTFGVVGAGAIGAATARKAAGLGYRVIGYDTAVEPGTQSRSGVQMVSFEQLLGESQVVSMHVPLTPETHHLMSTEQFAAMRPDAVIVNTSRGGVIDTDALVAALGSGEIAGAGLDVFEEEPLPAGHPLFGFEKVTLTPHAAWYTEESYLRLKQRTLQNVIDVCAGRVPRNILNPEVLGAA